VTTYRSITIAIIAALFLSASAGFAATICVNPASALCQPTIQLGINAAGPGDIVRIAAGTYFEAVAVPSGKDGLQLVGAGKLTTILDPSPYVDIGFAGFHGITVFARRVTIKNLMIRNGDGRGIEVHSPEVVIQGVNINGTNGDAIFVTNLAWNSRIVQSEIHNAGSGISSDAFGTVAQTNVITGTETGIFLQADAGQVLGNKIYSGVTGISAFGDGTVIKNNDIRHQRDLAVFVEGSYPTVQGNKVYGAGVGLQVACIDCFGGSVASNTITDATSYGILASADDFGLVLQSNTLLRTGRGLSINGIGITARLNKATDVGLDLFGHCFEAFGDDPTSITDANTIAQNTATRCSQAGIYVSGRETTVDRNVVSDTFENGITVDMSSLVVVSGNKATGNAAQGIAVLSASDTIVTGNTAKGNRRDFCNDSSDTTVLGNTFGTSFNTPGVDCTIAHIP
jgi:parallel beta-helix repeat protein